jgi:hypothetical protein
MKWYGGNARKTQAMFGRLKREAESSTTEVAPNVGQSKQSFLSSPFTIHNLRQSGIQRKTMVSRQTKSLPVAQKEYGGVAQKIQHMNGMQQLVIAIEETVVLFAPDKKLIRLIRLRLCAQTSQRSGIQRRMKN